MRLVGYHEHEIVIVIKEDIVQRLQSGTYAEAGSQVAERAV